MGKDYLRIFLGELNDIPSVQGAPYGLIQLGEEAYSKTGLGVLVSSKTWDLNAASMFEYNNESHKLSIVICDSEDGHAVSFASKSIGELLGGQNSQKYRFKLRGAANTGQDAGGIVLLRIERYHFESFPDRLEVRVGHSTGVPQCNRPRVRVIVANEKVSTDEAVVPSSGRQQPGEYTWNQQLVMAYYGHQQMQYEVVDSETGATICDGFYCLWELLAKEKEKFHAYGLNPLMAPEDEFGLVRKIGELQLGLRLWDSKEIAARVAEHDDKIKELRNRADNDKVLYNRIAPLMGDSERRSAAEFDRYMSMADSDLDAAGHCLTDMKDPAHSKGQLHTIKKALKDDTHKAQRNIEQSENALQNLTHHAAVGELVALREARSELQAIGRDLDTARQPIPGLSDEDDYELGALQTDRLDPLIAAADQAERDCNDAIAGIKTSSNCHEMNRCYDEARAAKQRVLDLIEQGQDIAEKVDAKMRERRRQARQAARNQMLGIAMTGYQNQYPKTVTVPALCCCWM